MDLENRFLAVKSFLHRHIELISTEVLENFNNLDSPYGIWAKEINQLTPDEKIRLENFEGKYLGLSSEFQQFIDEILELKKIPISHKSTDTIKQSLKRKLSLKKQHEIVQIKELLKDFESKRFLDIGSGAGHLSSILLDGNEKQSICLDMNKDYQEIGKKKLAREAKDIAQRINFVQAEIKRDTKFENYNYDTLLGLHTCGDLAVHLVKAFSLTINKNFLNFGCCYHKLSKERLNLSELSQQDPIDLTHHALTMAAKSYKKLTLREFQQRERVKNYRYTLHLYMTEVLNKNFVTLGNAKPGDYQEEFAFYAKKYLPDLKHFSNDELNQFYQDKKQNIQYIKNLGIVRSLTARLVELYLILDRALFLKENQQDVTVKEVFNSELSPRNIVILAKS